MTTLTFRLDEKLERALDRLAKSTGRLPGLSFKVRHDVEVLVSAEHGKPVLQCEGRDPGVVGRNRTARMLESDPQRGVCDRGRVRDWKNVEVRQFGVQPCFVGRSISGLRDAVTEFAKHENRNGGSRLPAQKFTNTSIAIRLSI
jgi:hypothetical protein